HIRFTESIVRSGCLSRRRFAGSPTTMPPSASMLTTDGHSGDPNGPGIHFGCPLCASVYATRLFVVPRSIPTIRPIPRSNLRQLFGDVCDQIPDVGPRSEEHTPELQSRAHLVCR